MMFHDMRAGLGVKNQLRTDSPFQLNRSAEGSSEMSDVSQVWNLRARYLIPFSYDTHLVFLPSLPSFFCHVIFFSSANVVHFPEFVSPPNDFFNTFR